MSYRQGSVYQQSLYQQPMQQNSTMYQGVHQSQQQIMGAQDVVSDEQYRYALQNFVCLTMQRTIIVLDWTSLWWIAYCPRESRAAAIATRGTRKTGSSAPSTCCVVRRRGWITSTRTRGDDDWWFFYQSLSLWIDHLHHANKDDDTPYRTPLHNLINLSTAGQPTWSVALLHHFTISVLPSWVMFHRLLV